MASNKLAKFRKERVYKRNKGHRNPFVWTIDPDVKVEQDVLDKGFMPVITDVNKMYILGKK